MGSRPTKLSSSVRVQSSTNEIKPKKDKDNDEKEEDVGINFKDFVIIWLNVNPIDRRLKSLNTFTRSFIDPQKCIKSIKKKLIFLIFGRVTLARLLLHINKNVDNYKQFKYFVFDNLN